MFSCCYLLLVGENWTFIIICVFCNETNKQMKKKEKRDGQPFKCCNKIDGVQEGINISSESMCIFIYLYHQVIWLVTVLRNCNLNRSAVSQYWTKTNKWEVEKKDTRRQNYGAINTHSILLFYEGGVTERIELTYTYYSCHLISLIRWHADTYERRKRPGDGTNVIYTIAKISQPFRFVFSSFFFWKNSHTTIIFGREEQINRNDFGRDKK